MERFDVDVKYEEGSWHPKANLRPLPRAVAGRPP